MCKSIANPQTVFSPLQPDCLKKLDHCNVYKTSWFIWDKGAWQGKTQVTICKDCNLKPEVEEVFNEDMR